MISRRHVVAIAVVSIALAMLAVACDNGRPTEADLPAEADLVYPGAVEISRSFADGDNGTNIDGGSVDRAPRLNVVYELDGVSNEELLQWYETELTDLGWTVDVRSERVISLDRDPEGDLNFGYGVTARVETAGEYDVVVVVDRDRYQSSRTGTTSDTTKTGAAHRQ